MRYILLLIFAMVIAAVIGIILDIEQTFINFVILTIASLAILVKSKPFIDRYLAFIKNLYI